MSDCIILRHGGKKKYIWNRYNRNSTTTYVWNRYNVVTTTTYTWNRYNLNTSTSTSYYAEQTSSTKTIYWASMHKSSTYWSTGMPTLSSNGRFQRNGSLSNSFFNSALPQDYVGYYYFERTNSSSCYYITSATGKDDGSGRLTGRLIEAKSKTETSYSRGTFIDTVSSSSSSSYPSNGHSGNYWYVSNGSSTTYSRGTANGSVSSTNKSQYPDDGRSGSYWYVYSTSNISYSQGSYIDQVESKDRNTYPDNSYSGSYWYVYQGESGGSGSLKRILAG